MDGGVSRAEWPPPQRSSDTELDGLGTMDTPRSTSTSTRSTPLDPTCGGREYYSITLRRDTNMTVDPDQAALVYSKCP